MRVGVGDSEPGEEGKKAAEALMQTYLLTTGWKKPSKTPSQR